MQLPFCRALCAATTNSTMLKPIPHASAVGTQPQMNATLFDDEKKNETKKTNHTIITIKNYNLSLVCSFLISTYFDMPGKCVCVCARVYNTVFLCHLFFAHFHGSEKYALPLPFKDTNYSHCDSRQCMCACNVQVQQRKYFVLYWYSLLTATL